MQESPVLVTVPEVAAALRVAPMTVRRWIADGKLPATRVGRDYRVRTADLEALVSASSTTGEVPA